jgi:hypothetical protein
MRAYGPDTESWVGTQIDLTLGTVKFQGKDQEAVIVSPEIDDPEIPY